MGRSQNNGDSDTHEVTSSAENPLNTGGAIHELHDFFLDAGILSERSGDLPAALNLYEQAIQSEPESAIAWYNYGDILLALERFEDAEASLRTAVGLAPKTTLFHYDLGMALFNLGRHDEASKEFAAIIAGDPQLERASSCLHLSSMTNLALCQDELGRSKEAAKILDPARQTAVDILYNLGRFNYRAKRLKAALSYARAAELLTPKSEEVVHLLGSVLMDLKRHQEAMEVLIRATKLNPRCASAWYDLGVTLTRMKKNKKARSYFQKSLGLDPTHGWTYYCLACLDALERKTEAAFAKLEMAIVHGFRNATHLRRDSDLRSLRRDPRWKAIVKRAARPVGDESIVTVDPALPRGVDTAKTLFRDEGLVFPAIPDELAAELKEQSRWLFSTRKIDISPYNLDHYVDEVDGIDVEDYAVLSHSGHGANSYAIQYYLVHGSLRMFLHLGWGGVYSDADADVGKIRRCFSLADQIVPAASKLGKDDRLTIVASDFYGSHWSAPKQSRQNERSGANGPAEVLAEALHWLTNPGQGNR